MDRERWLVLEPLLSQALQLEPNERAGWLAQLSRDSADVAADLAQLLASEEEVEDKGFLATPLAAPSDADLTGTTLGGYRLERPLGAGGMGSVWLGERADGRYKGVVAIKLLNLALLHRVGQERFRREGTVLAQLTHPGIARLLDAGVAAAGQPFLVLEYIDGVPLNKYAGERQLSDDAKIQLILQVLDSVAHAHANLIVHRDLKPSNILVTSDGRTKLLDFGIAKLLSPTDAVDQSQLTVDGGRVLTPAYAAPEQVRGEAVTTATDVYAIGVILYELLDGRHPTASDTSNVESSLRALLEHQPHALGRGDLDNILLKALKKAPAERYQTVQAFAEDLRRYLRHEPVMARPDSVAYRVKLFVRRNRVPVTATFVFVASLTAATIFSIRQLREAERQRDFALEAQAQSDAQVEFQSLMMGEIGDRPITLRDLVGKVHGMMEYQHANSPRIYGSLLLQLASAYSLLGDDANRRALITRAESLGVAHNETSLIISARCHMADVQRISGKPDEAERLLADAEARLKAAPDREAEITCVGNRGQLEEELGDSSHASARKLVRLLEEANRTRSSAYAGALALLGAALDREQKFSESIALYARSLAQLDSIGWGSTINAMIVRHNRALLLSRMGQTDSAEREFHAVVRMAGRSDTAAPVPVQLLIHYAWLASVQQRNDSALKYYTRLADQALRTGSFYWQTRALFGKAQSEIRLGDTVAARQSFARFVTTRPKVERLTTDDQILSPLLLEAELALALQPRRTIDRVKQALAEHVSTQGDSPAHRWFALTLGARAALQAGDVALARAYADSARGVSTDSLQPGRWTGEALLLRAQAEVLAGDTAQARALFTAALPALRRGAGESHPLVHAAQRGVPR